LISAHGDAAQAALRTATRTSYRNYQLRPKRTINIDPFYLDTDLTIGLLNCRTTGKGECPMLRLTFARKCPERKGDNCLLTRDSAFVDLSFYSLLA